MLGEGLWYHATLRTITAPGCPGTRVTLWGVLLECVEDLGCVHATILLVITTHCEWACHGGEPILVVIDDLEIDHKVHGHVGKLWILFPQMSPRYEMTIQLVVALMQYEETKLGIIA